MKILVIRLHRLGDVLQLTPMLEGIKKRYPGASTTFLTSGGLSDALSGNPFLDRIITVPELRWRRLARGGPDDRAKVFHAAYGLSEDLRQERFDLVVNRQYEEGAILAALTGAPRIGGGVFSLQHGHVFADEPSRELFEVVKSDRRRNRRNLADWSLCIAGVPPGTGRMLLNIPPANAREADHLLDSIRGERSPVAVQLGAARSFRCWGTDRFLPVIRHLAASRERPVILLGSPDERGLAERILAGCGPVSGRIVDLVGKTSLKTLGAVLQRCEGLVSGDTGTAHVAAAVGTPVLSLFFGTAYPWETAPYGTGNLVLFPDLPCAPCLDPSSCRHGRKCREAIRPEHVCRAWEMLDLLLSGAEHAGRWQDDGVRLLVSRVDHGRGMTLGDFNEWKLSGASSGESSIPKEESLNIIRSLTPRQAAGNALAAGFETGDLARLLHSRKEKAPSRSEESGKDFQLLEERESRLCGALYLHEEPWEDAFADYLDAWRHFIAFGCAKQEYPEGLRILMKNLPPLFSEASSALSSGDPVALADLLRSGFRPLRESIRASIDQRTRAAN